MPRKVIVTPWVVLTSCASVVAGNTTTTASQQRSLERIATSSSSRSMTRFGTARALPHWHGRRGGVKALAGALTAALGGRRFGGPTSKGLSHGVDPGLRSVAQLDPVDSRCSSTDPRVVRSARWLQGEAALVRHRRRRDRSPRRRG